MRKISLILLALIFCLMASAVAMASDNTTKSSKDALDIDQPAEIITASEMEKRLYSGLEGDILYVKLSEEKVEIYTGISKDRSLRKQIIIGTPNEEMLRLYSNNKATALQMSRMLTNYEADNKNINGYRIITDMDKPKKLENGTKVYRLWFMKIEREKPSRNSRFPINIGIGIGGRHDGPYIGIGL